MLFVIQNAYACTKIPHLHCPPFDFPVCVSGQTYTNICFARVDGKYGTCGRDMKPGRCDPSMTIKQDAPEGIVSDVLPSLRPTQPISITSSPQIVSAPMPHPVPKPVGISDHSTSAPVKFKPGRIQK